MDFKTAVSYLEKFRSYQDIPAVLYGSDNFNLDRFKNFLREFRVDYLKLRCVHVAGSKGKGTVVNLIAKYLSAVGFKTGMFISPYMWSVLECFVVNGKIISKEEFCALVSLVKNFFDGLVKGNEFENVTYFEILTALVFKYFLDCGVDYAILEVGLGGRLDSTNVVIPDLCILTAVELEHIGILGNSLEEIIDEKLGILKSGVPVLIGPQSVSAGDIVRRRLEGRGLVYFVDDVSDGCDFCFAGFDREGRCLERIFSNAMKKNFLTVSKGIEVLLGSFDGDVFNDVVSNFKLIGREDVREINGKNVVFDIAHTPESVANLIDFLDRRFLYNGENDGKKFVFIFSLLRDKDVFKILPLICGKADKVIFVSSHVKRSYSGVELEDFARQIGAECEIVVEDIGGDSGHETWVTFFERILRGLKNDQVLVVTGSHYLVREVLPQ